MLFLCIVMIFVIAAVYSNFFQESLVDKSKNMNAESKKEKLQFWMRAETKNSVTGKLVEKYNKENKDNVEVELQVFGDNYKNVVTTALATGNQIDIFELMGGLNIQQLASAGYIMPIDEFVTEDIKKQIYPDAFKQKQFYYGGKIYAIPERTGFFRLMYNKEIFKKAGITHPPATVEELEEDSKKITAVGKGEFYGFCVPMKSNEAIGRFTDNLSAVSHLTGEAAFDWEKGSFDFMKQKKALQLLINMKTEKVLYPDSLYCDIDLARAKFAQGKIGMMIDGNWMVGVYGNNEIKCNIDWDSAPIPVFDGYDRYKSYISYDMAKLISANSINPTKAWHFIRYLIENQSEFVKNGEPLRTSIAANDKKNIPLNYKGIQGFSDIQNSKVFPLKIDNFLTTLEGDNYQKVYYNILAGEVNIDEGLQDLTIRYNKALQKSLDLGILNEEDIKMSEVDYFTNYGISK